MLTAYLDQTRRLLQNPAAPTSLYSNADLTAYINIARGQVAAEGASIRVSGQIACVVGQTGYAFSNISLSPAGPGFGAAGGVGGIIHIRAIMQSSGIAGVGLRWLVPRPYEWYLLYGPNRDAPVNAVPTLWSQYGQGGGGGTFTATGSFYLYPPPDDTYILTCDCVCYPITMVSDATIEAIPFMWTDAVPYFAAYLAYLSAQTGARQADADRMWTHYQTFMTRARQFANPDPNKWMYSQAPATEGSNPLAQAGGER